MSPGVSVLVQTTAPSRSRRSSTRLQDAKPFGESVPVGRWATTGLRNNLDPVKRGRGVAAVEQQRDVIAAADCVSRSLPRACRVQRLGRLVAHLTGRPEGRGPAAPEWWTENGTSREASSLAPEAENCSARLLGGCARWPVSGRPVAVWVRGLPHLDGLGLAVRALRNVLLHPLLLSLRGGDAHVVKAAPDLELVHPSGVGGGRIRPERSKYDLLADDDEVWLVAIGRSGFLCAVWGPRCRRSERAGGSGLSRVSDDSNLLERASTFLPVKNLSPSGLGPRRRHRECLTRQNPCAAGSLFPATP
jgi:hypothetical protein